MNKLPLLYIIEDDLEMSELYERYLKGIARVRRYTDAVSAISAIDEEMPKMIILDLLLDGPDGFTFLNEIVSYKKTAKIPVLLVSSIGISSAEDLRDYGVVDILNKEIMAPEDIKAAVKFWTSENVRFE